LEGGFVNKTLEFAIFLMLATCAKHQSGLSVPKEELGIGKKDRELDSLRSILESSEVLQALGLNAKQRREIVETLRPRNLKLAIDRDNIEISAEAYRFKSSYKEKIREIRRKITTKKKSIGSELAQISQGSIEEEIAYLERKLKYLVKKHELALELKQKAYRIWLKFQRSSSKSK